MKMKGKIEIGWLTLNEYHKSILGLNSKKKLSNRFTNSKQTQKNYISFFRPTRQIMMVL